MEGGGIEIEILIEIIAPQATGPALLLTNHHFTEFVRLLSVLSLIGLPYSARSFSEFLRFRAFHTSLPTTSY
ncbi:hypothetical protein CBS63078_10651 [Aspergillus niger]|nr:hypothetical protein CBS63078_10651 [Aspergillus niger]KAI3018045.1 hypothetical protein CBS147345_4300 [Aspergillus niger]